MKGTLGKEYLLNLAAFSRSEAAKMTSKCKMQGREFHVEYAIAHINYAHAFARMLKRPRIKCMQRN